MFAAGQMVQIEDDPGIGLVAILQGTVRFLRHVASDEPTLIHIGEPGLWFGQMAVIDDGRTLATAVTRSRTKALVLARTAFNEFIAADARLGAAVSHVVHERSRLIYRYHAESRVLPIDARLQRRLADLAELRRQEVRIAGPSVSLDISQAELAALVGVSRPHVNVRLRALQAEGLLTLGRRRIVVVNPTALRTRPGISAQ